MYIIIGAAGALFGATALLMYQQYVTGKIEKANKEVDLDPPETTSTKVTRELSKLREALEESLSGGGGLRGHEGGLRGHEGGLRGLRGLRELRQTQLNELNEIAAGLF
jgi:hypothetical protein